MVDNKPVSAKERLALLKELEKKRKKEIKETEREIEKAQEDIKKEELIREIEVPRDEQTNIDTLFEGVDQTLEQTVGEEPPPQGPEYQIPSGLQDEITGIYNQLNTLRYNENWTENDFQTFYDASDRLGEIRERFEEKLDHGYTISENVTNRLVASQSVEYNIKKYREFGK